MASAEWKAWRKEELAITEEERKKGGGDMWVRLNKRLDKRFEELFPDDQAMQAKRWASQGDPPKKDDVQEDYGAPLEHPDDEEIYQS